MSNKKYLSIGIFHFRKKKCMMHQNSSVNSLHTKNRYTVITTYYKRNTKYHASNTTYYTPHTTYYIIKIAYYKVHNTYYKLHNKNNGLHNTYTQTLHTLILYGDGS